MTENTTQPCRSPMESSLRPTEEKFDIRSPSPVVISTDNQRAPIQFNTSSMMPNAATSNQIVRNDIEQVDLQMSEQLRLLAEDKEAFQRRQKEKRQRLNEIEQYLKQQRRRLDQAQQLINQERQRLKADRSRERRRRHHQRQKERRSQLQPTHLPRSVQQYLTPTERTQPSRFNHRDFYERLNRDPSRETIDQNYMELLLETYDDETRDLRERELAWEQEHLREMQGLSETSSDMDGPLDDLVSYALERDRQREQDQLEQDMQIIDIGNDEYSKRSKQNEQQLMDKEEWEDIAFRLQQQP